MACHRYIGIGLVCCPICADIKNIHLTEHKAEKKRFVIIFNYSIPSELYSHSPVMWCLDNKVYLSVLKYPTSIKLAKLFCFNFPFWGKYWLHGVISSVYRLVPCFTFTMLFCLSLGPRNPAKMKAAFWHNGSASAIANQKSFRPNVALEEQEELWKFPSPPTDGGGKEGEEGE